jgi:hypothetical protein
MARRSPENKKNPRNPKNPLFRQLTKLLSGPLVKYRRQDAKRLKRRQLDKYATRFRSASGQEFKMSSYGDIYGALQAEYYANQNRMDRYVDFDQMEYTPEIASSLDIYADEMTTSSLYTPILNIICSNAEIKAVLETLYYNILNVEFNLYGWSRSMCKYGDFFLYLDIEEDEGIKNVIGLPPNEIERLEGEDKNNPNYIQYQWNTAGLTLENWQMAHFRILGNDKFSPYGTSALEAARRIWRQLTLLEDAMMAYRIVRSPDRRAFYIDVGNIPPQEVEQYMQRVMTQMKRNQIVDINSGRVDLRYNPLSIEEDYYIPVRGAASSTKIENIQGGKNASDIDDVKYLRDKLFSALKVPASYLTQSETAQEDKTTLAQKDIRFARTIQRLQRSLVSELEKIGIVHLFTMGYRGNDLLSFKLALNNPSRIAELQELDHWKAKFGAAAEANEGYFSRRWVSRNILNISEEEFERMQTEAFYDRKHDFALEQVGEAAAAAAGMGPGAGLDDEMGGDMDLGAPGEDESPPEEEAAAPEEESTLLATPEGPAAEEAPPGNRDDWPYPKDKFGRRVTTTPKSHGWYHPSAGDERKTSGPRLRSMRGQYSAEMSRDTPRNVFKGYPELSSLYEQKRSNYYTEEETKLFKENYEIKKLIKSLENIGDQIDEV